MNDNAPADKRRDQRHLWLGVGTVIYGGGFIADWAWWVHDGGLLAVLVGWEPALVWPIHAASFVWGLIL